MSTRCPVLVLFALLGAVPALAQTPTGGSWREEVRRLRDAPIVLPARGAAKQGRLAPLLAARRPTTALVESIVAESEPNDSVRTADSAALGDQATGVVNPAGDVDTWFVDLAAGQFFSADVDAAQNGSPLDATLQLIASDGTTSLAFNDDFDGFDSRISYRVLTSGRYYVVIRAFGATGGPGLTYAINFGKVICPVVGTEQEPNDSPGTAAPVAIGDSGSGEICPADDNPAGDVDYWAFTARAGTTIELDVDAEQLGLPVDPVIALYASDGTTRLAFNDNADGADSRLQYSIITTGTYYATVAEVVGSGGNPFPYVFHFRSITPGPGDPITVRAEGLGLPLGLAVGSTGDLFVGDVAGNRVVRASGQGVVTTFAAGIPAPFGLAFDAFGHLLVASVDGAVYRVTPQGQATRFITDAEIPFWIAVAPDGRIWLTDLSDRSLRRYSPTGQFEARFDAVAVGGSGPGPLAIGPSGEPYFSQGTEIWKLEDGQLRRVFTDASIIWAFAFDVAGNVYVPSPVAGRLKVFDAAGTTVADPFAVGPDAPQALAFGRDGTGATVARVFATDTRVGRVFEVNPAGVGHPGLPVGYVPSFTLDVATAGLLGAGGLSAADVQYLDALGNRNGRYDVGDLQAYLRMVGGLPAQRRPGSDR
jgi:sugar lactone lactonase YvrE